MRKLVDVEIPEGLHITQAFVDRINERTADDRSTEVVSPAGWLSDTLILVGHPPAPVLK